MEYGGMEIPDTFTLQDQLQVPYILKQVRWDSTVANDLLTTLEEIQLASGFVRPIMEFTDLPISYIDQGLLIKIRKRMGGYEAGIWFEGAWTPELQRERDAAIMEAFVRILGITPRQLEKANACRLYLRVHIRCRPGKPSGQLYWRWDAHW